MWQVRDELWRSVEPLLPEHRPDPRGGRPRVEDRVAFGAIVFVSSRYCLAPPATRARLLAGHRAPSPARLAAPRRLRATAPGALAPAERGRAHRLVARGD